VSLLLPALSIVAKHPLWLAESLSAACFWTSPAGHKSRPSFEVLNRHSHIRFFLELPELASGLPELVTLNAAACRYESSQIEACQRLAFETS